jgi:hypothetical protein
MMAPDLLRLFNVLLLITETITVILTIIERVS